MTLTSIADCLSNNAPVLIKARTYAFCVLALSELFYAIGMRDAEHSIFTFKMDNKVMILAFAFGLLTQLAVTEIPILTTIFETVGLSAIEWLALLGVSAVPVLIHEIIVICKKIKSKV